MKKMVVVVKGEKLVFQGEDLEAIDRSSRTDESVGTKILIIRETIDNKTVNIAVFKHWDYWKEVRENDQTLKNKVLLRAEKSWSASRTTKFMKALNEYNMVLIPADIKVIVVDGIGQAKIL